MTGPRRRPIGDDTAAVEEHEAREEHRGQPEVVHDREDRRAVTLVEVPQQLHRIDLVAQVEVDGRLVEDEDRRCLRHGQREEDELALAERQLTCVTAEQVADADTLDGRSHGGAIGRPGPADRVFVGQAPEPDDLLDPGGERQHHLLRDDRQAARDRRAGKFAHGVAAEADVAAHMIDEAAEDPQERRLAGAVRPDQGDPLAGTDRQVDAVEDRPAPVLDRDAAQLDHSS